VNGHRGPSPLNRPYVIGLTGSIAMGKSETARLFAAEGVPVHDADAVIHKLYGVGGAAVDKIAGEFPGAVSHGAVDRAALSALVAANAAALKKLESLVHPLVIEDRDAFLADAAQKGAEIVVLDIPLLLETGVDGIDALVVVSAPAAVQRERALKRPGMTEEKFATLLARQMPDVEKRAKAHFVIVTDQGVAHAREQVKMVLAAIREKFQKHGHA
jgi:dephospho-CoA kinase